MTSCSYVLVNHEQAVKWQCSHLNLQITYVHWDSGIKTRIHFMCLCEHTLTNFTYFKISNSFKLMGARRIFGRGGGSR